MIESLAETMMKIKCNRLGGHERVQTAKKCRSMLRFITQLDDMKSAHRIMKNL